ncbi:MAG: cytochrome d ubiquinol oxidase subunit II [Oligoflexia bacterium]|nr:cytochrome d ubiquinol oxidase subunit II [Oligoflexia bacterium]
MISSSISSTLSTIELLQISWFLLIGSLLAVYAVLDGFDLGVGIVHLVNSNDKDRHRNFKLITPFWDGNEVWLLTAGGALFAAFPNAYATIFSAFYLPFMFLIFSLIFRAISMEFRDKFENKGSKYFLKWKKLFDYSFAYSSMLVSFLFGVAIANIIRGLPLDNNGNYIADIFFMLNPYSMLVGITVVLMFATHGALYLCFRNDHESDSNLDYVKIAVKNRILAGWLWIPFNIFYFLSAMITILYYQREHKWISLLFFALSILFMFLNKFYNYKKKDLLAFLFSSLTIIFAFLLVLSTLFPYFVPNFVSNVAITTNSITIYNSSSSKNTLAIMLLLAFIGMPLVIAYTTYIYKTFIFKKNSLKI